MRFPFLRLTILTLVLLAQVYLFLRIRTAIRASGRDARAARRLAALIGLLFCLLFALNTYMAWRPIPWVDPPRMVQLGLFYLAAVWSFGSLFSGLALLLVRFLALCGRAIRAVLRHRPHRAAEERPVDPGRRRILQAGMAGVVAAPVVLSGYGAAYAAKAWDVRELHLPFGRRLRVVQLTDIHAGIYMRRDDMRRQAVQAIALEPDILVLTGDFISNSMVFLPGCLAEMARVRPRLGTFAVLGNHEHMYGRMSELQAVFRDHGIPLLVNEHRIVGTSEGDVAVAGIDSLLRGAPDLPATLRGLPAGMPTLLLSHYPEIFPAAAAEGVPLTLSGHWHGGQVTLRLPGGAVSFAHLRTPFPEGLYRRGMSHLYVSRGLGTTATPVRLNAPPEITVFHLT